MPIEFRCSGCQKLLRTPDESAGKMARCPHCGTIADVPASGLASSPASAGQAIGSNPFAPGGGNSLPSTNVRANQASFLPSQPTSSDNPYAAPSLREPAVQFPPLDMSPRAGLPWETQGKSFRTFWATTKLIFNSPTLAFRMMRREGGFGDPMLFTIAGGLVGGLMTAVYNSALQGILFGVLAGGLRGNANNGVPGFMVLIQVLTQFGAALFFGTIGAIIGMFVAGGLHHLCLMLLQGARAPFETTVRVAAYVSGAVSLLQVIPLCGQYVYGIAGIVFSILGLSAAHEISGGKATAAVLLPIFACVGLVVAVIVAFVGGFAAFGINR